MKDIMALTGLTSRYHYSKYNSRFSNYTEAELQSFAQAVVSAQAKLTAAKTALATLNSNYNQDKSANLAILPVQKTYYGVICFDTTQTPALGSSAHLAIGKLVGAAIVPYTETGNFTVNDMTFFPMIAFKNRLFAYPTQIANQQKVIDQAQKDYDTAEAAYQKAKDTLTPQQKLTLDAQRAQITSATATDSVKRTIMWIGAGLLAATAIFVAIYEYKKVKKS